MNFTFLFNKWKKNAPLQFSEAERAGGGQRFANSTTLFIQQKPNFFGLLMNGREIVDGCAAFASFHLSFHQIQR